MYDEIIYKLVEIEKKSDGNPFLIINLAEFISYLEEAQENNADFWDTFTSAFGVDWVAFPETKEELLKQMRNSTRVMCASIELEPNHRIKL